MGTLGTTEATTAMASDTMVDTMAMDTDTAWGTTDTGAGRGGLLTLLLLLIPKLIPISSMAAMDSAMDTDWDTMEDTATTCTERGLPTLTLTLLLTPRLTPTCSMVTMDSAMVATMAIPMEDMEDTTGDKL